MLQAWIPESGILKSIILAVQLPKLRISSHGNRNDNNVSLFGDGVFTEVMESK